MGTGIVYGLPVHKSGKKLMHLIKVSFTPLQPCFMKQHVGSKMVVQYEKGAMFRNAADNSQ